MPTERSGDRHASPRRAYQLDDDAWEQFGQQAAAEGKTRSAIVTEFVLWRLGRRADPPKRPK